MEVLMLSSFTLVNPTCTSLEYVYPTLRHYHRHVESVGKWFNPYFTEPMRKQKVRKLSPRDRVSCGGHALIIAWEPWDSRLSPDPTVPSYCLTSSPLRAVLLTTKSGSFGWDAAVSSIMWSFLLLQNVREILTKRSWNIMEMNMN